MVSVLDVEEQEGAGHEHAQYGDGGQDAVEGHVDVAPLQAHKRTILRRLHTCDKEGEKKYLKLNENSETILIKCFLLKIILSRSWEC